jgi:hypothetical protein
MEEMPITDGHTFAALTSHIILVPKNTDRIGEAKKLLLKCIYTPANYPSA